MLTFSFVILSDPAAAGSEESISMYREHHYYTYVMSNVNRSVLYIGVNNDLIRRIIEHKNGIGSYFTKKI